MTTRQTVIKQVGYKLGRNNFNAYALANNLPLTDDFQTKLAEYKERFGAELTVNHVEQRYATMLTNSVEGYLLGFAEESGYKGWLNELTDNQYKLLLNAIYKESERVKFIHIDSAEAKVRRQAKAQELTGTDLCTDALKVVNVYNPSLGFETISVDSSPDMTTVGDKKGYGFDIRLLMAYNDYKIQLHTYWDKVDCHHVFNAEIKVNMNMDNMNKVARMINNLKILIRALDKIFDEEGLA